ncbi:hypothetical protein MMC19_004080 [Ptychographa xylographoides]|nr:hypothetical protein [Ptychographa xylographoides]
MSYYPDTEGLQVALPHPQQYSDLEHNGPNQTDPAHRAPEPCVIEPPKQTSQNPAYQSLNQSSSEKYGHPSDGTQPARTCGLRRRTFWLLLILGAIVVLAAALGGGIGGSLASKANTNPTPLSIPTSTLPTVVGATAAAASSTSTSTSTSSPLPTSPPTTTSTPPISTSTIVSATSTLLRDCPSSNDTTLTVTLGAASLSFLKNCSTAYSASKSVNENFVNQPTTSLDDCIALCAQWNINDHVSTSGEPQTCDAVCWRNGFAGDDYPGQCFGFAVAVEGDSAATANDTRCDSALWINQPGS